MSWPSQVQGGHFLGGGADAKGGERKGQPRRQKIDHAGGAEATTKRETSFGALLFLVGHTQRRAAIGTQQ